MPSTAPDALTSFLEVRPGRIAYTFQEVAEQSGYSVSWVREERRAGRLAYVKVSGSRNLILADDLVALFDPTHKHDGRDTLCNAFQGRAMLTADQVAHATGLHPTTVRRLCHLGSEHGGMDGVQVKPGARVMIPRTSLVRFLSEKRVPARWER